MTTSIVCVVKDGFNTKLVDNTTHFTVIKKNTKLICNKIKWIFDEIKVDDIVHKIMKIKLVWIAQSD